MEIEKIPDPIITVEDAQQLVRWCVENIGLGYHPDTPFEEYINRERMASFDPKVAERLNGLHDRAFELLGDSIYETGMEILRATYPELWEEDERENQPES